MKKTYFVSAFLPSSVPSFVECKNAILKKCPEVKTAYHINFFEEVCKKIFRNSNAIIISFHQLDDHGIIEGKTFDYEENEKEIIIEALKENKNRRVVAEELGMSERTLYRKIKDYSIEF